MTYCKCPKRVKHYKYRNSVLFDIMNSFSHRPKEIKYIELEIPVEKKKGTLSRISPDLHEKKIKERVLKREGYCTVY